jgi:EVE domain
MNIFIFQSVVKDNFDLRNEIREGHRDSWWATRYQNNMSPGDYVFFWLGGDEKMRGLYGWGILTSQAYRKSGDKDDGVDFEYTVKFKRPILAKELRTDPELGNLMIFRAPQASNFILEPQQAKQLLRFISKRGEIVPDIGGQL